MKATTLAVVLSFLVLSGWTLAAQTAEQKKDSSMMEHMMKEGEGEKGHGGMMRMMKMMDQCSRMMDSHGSEEPKESLKKNPTEQGR
jgi:Spy/CpxP family protein refolding chaperone